MEELSLGDIQSFLSLGCLKKLKSPSSPFQNVTAERKKIQKSLFADDSIASDKSSNKIKSNKMFERDLSLRLTWL
ncbi:hypothetical protein CEXT_118981 [Caerostris extrusa]|uniref:Uncharacterized protein n=1 Tax=Caerostris extrusa TaxID=172846 RepID=A0AAV4Y227_CAEEX|nr:hypothetical protein CEXT_118981 [Caerostris extrusa]